MANNSSPGLAGPFVVFVFTINYLNLVSDAFLPSNPPFNARPPKPFVGKSCLPLLGIKGFRAWFEATFPSAVVTIKPNRYGVNGSKKSGGDRKKRCHPETFDHVLIDANQIIHSTLRNAYNRRSKRTNGTNLTPGQQQVNDDTIEHSLLFFLKEIDHITTNIAVPRKSVVIAIDGSPAAAKLNTQRRRKFSIYKKAESQERQIEILRRRGWKDSDFGKNGINQLFSKHERERLSLMITPGTAFMSKVTDALLYWSWKYVSRFPRVSVYISPSHVHGEGEVKLQDWILHGYDQSRISEVNHSTNVKQNDTIAIVGGDSDLVLIGLAVPSSITHNIHVILRGNKSRSLVVSLWETTRIMASMMEGTTAYGDIKSAKKPRDSQENSCLTLRRMNLVRLDMVLLIMMNGNDYLPKLPGLRAGFDSLFGTYLDLVRAWPDGKNGCEKAPCPCLVRLDGTNEVCINVPFALAFFQALSSDSQMPASSTNTSNGNSSPPPTQLGTLLNLVAAKILPGPISFSVTRSEDYRFHQKWWGLSSKLRHNTTFVGNKVSRDEAEMIRLTLGHFPDGDFSTPIANEESGEIFTTILKSDGRGLASRVRGIKICNKAGGRAYLFEVPHRKYNSIKSAKTRLSCLALEEIFGTDDVGELFGGGGSGQNGQGCVTILEKPRGLAQADAAHYLGGLLWNLETYLYGCCADYGYDYGRRAPPSPSELTDFLESKKKQGNLEIKCIDLIERSTTTPLSDGLACLAAIPPQAYHIVPEPYSWLVEPPRSTFFEDLYSSCFHPDTMAFDIQSFEEKCNAELLKIITQQNANIVVAERESGVSHEKNPKGKRIYAGKKSWTVISFSKVPLAHPFEPPEPFTGLVYRLRKNKRIRATELPRKVKLESSNNLFEIEDSEARSSKQNIQSVHDIPYKIAFKSHDHV